SSLLLRRWRKLRLFHRRWGRPLARGDGGSRPVRAHEQRESGILRGGEAVHPPFLPRGIRLSGRREGTLGRRRPRPVFWGPWRGGRGSGRWGGRNGRRHTA